MIHTLAPLIELMELGSSAGMTSSTRPIAPSV